MEMANTLAYWDTATITAVKSLTVQVQGIIRYHIFITSLKNQHQNLPNG